MLVSGTHGVEGYYGSDSQIALLDNLRDHASPEDTCVVLVHLVNPLGTAWLRRVNEDNADANRNYIDFTQAPPANIEYETLHEIYLCVILTDRSVSARMSNSPRTCAIAGKHACAISSKRDRTGIRTASLRRHTADVDEPHGGQIMQAHVASARTPSLLICTPGRAPTHTRC